MKTWEYCVLTEVWVTNPYSTKFEIEFPDPTQVADFISEGMRLVDVLNHMGLLGWEAINLDSETVENGTVTKVFFKRKIKAAKTNKDEE
jgi:hypothetical protein